jgi:hypothetical protein
MSSLEGYLPVGAHLGYCCWRGGLIFGEKSVGWFAVSVVLFVLAVDWKAEVQLVAFVIVDWKAEVQLLAGLLESVA